MSNLDVAKDLLRKGLLLGDPELVAMANKLLGESEGSTIITDVSSAAKRGRPPKKSKVGVDKEEKSAILNIDIPIGKSTVQWKKNTWVDTGQSGDIEKKHLKTPKITPEPRRPPYKKVSHKCSLCLESFMIYPHDKTEFYKCEKCIRKAVGR